MRITASSTWDAWSGLPARLPADLNPDLLARTAKSVQRQRGDGVIDGTTPPRPGLARGPGGKSLPAAAVWAHVNGIAEITGKSLNERPHGPVTFLSAVAHHLLAGRPAVRSGIWKGRCLRIADGGVLSQRGSKGAGWRVHGVHDPGRGTFSHLKITDSHGAESLLRCAPVAGEALIALALPAGKVAVIRGKLRRKASRSQKKPGPRTLVAAGSWCWRSRCQRRSRRRGSSPPTGYDGRSNSPSNG